MNGAEKIYKIHIANPTNLDCFLLFIGYDVTFLFQI